MKKNCLFVDEGSMWVKITFRKTVHWCHRLLPRNGIYETQIILKGEFVQLCN